MLKVAGVCNIKIIPIRKGSMELHKHENHIFFLPINILTVWCASFLGCMTHYRVSWSVSINNIPDIIPQLATWIVFANIATFLRQLLSSWRDKFIIHKNSSFRKWASWCTEQDKNLFSSPKMDVANFLAEPYEQGYQYSSLNAYCSVKKVDGQPVGQILRVLKGACNMRPPLNRL